MVLQIHNTLSRQKEDFKPIDAQNVRMYVCGPTVYDFAHLGNARPVVVFDTLYRLLKRHYPRVTYVRNITDIDDKIMAKAKTSGVPIDTITEQTIKAYHEDMASLNALPPDFEPRCTQYVGQMVAMIADLVKKGHAYAAKEHVLFNVPSMKDYGQLSRRPMDDIIAGARVEVAPYKKDPSDFVLWKPSAKDQPGWDSPWGRGRPGWHIECSAMAKEKLGETFDIHGGGLDLIFPHHENEIAQSRCSHGGAPLANYWMHNGFLTINSDKMSKSLGNFFTVRQLLALAPGEALRLALMTGHYRQPLDFSPEALQSAKGTLDRWYGALRSVSAVQAEKTKPSDKFEDALLDDLNTPLAIAHIHEMVNELNRAGSAAEQAPIKAQILASGEAIGLLQQDPEIWFKWSPAGQSGPTDAEIEAQIAARLAARQSKNFAEADRIRKTLAEQGVVLEDGAGGTTWREDSMADASEQTYKPLSLKDIRKRRKPPRNVIKENSAKASALDRAALWITEKVGTMGFFLLIFTWTVLWLGWNLLAPKNLQFDPPMGFILWLFISNLIQILLMPLIMLGQNIQGQHAEARAEYDLEVNVKAEEEIETILYHLEYQNNMLITMMEKLGCSVDALKKNPD